MNFIIYTSYAATDFSEDQLAALLVQSRNRNKVMDITGMLFYFDGKFIQLIEGDKTAVNLLYNDICNDVRHKYVITLKQGEITSRYFNDWSMGFKSISPNELANVENYKNLQSPSGPDINAILSLIKLTAADHA